MEKINNKRHHSFFVLLCMFHLVASSQSKSGLESYNMLNRQKQYIWMPVVHYQSEKGMYTEFRYNYEDIQTISVYAGKSFSTGKDFKGSIIPMLGVSVGRFSGASLAANAEAEWKNFYLSSQTQFSMATKKSIANFFFSWSELGYNIFRNMFAGLAIQYTRQQGVSVAEPGFVWGLSFGNISIPLYVFNPFGADRYVILGINFEYRFKDRKKI